ncbi:hypothetical protein CTEN210_01981 [Chaetoceros tenuissimus]|uniref:PIN domain-containing protein n=1 Tax=Chaetoceros tenuissimus TaxID=426638 RepID=A0AAD3CG53_9STRA|nr:hypothetical protein CTEN210_01981 [Chaetoceros tenuissimus]
MSSKQTAQEDDDDLASFFAEIDNLKITDDSDEDEGDVQDSKNKHTVVVAKAELQSCQKQENDTTTLEKKQYNKDDEPGENSEKCNDFMNTKSTIKKEKQQLIQRASSTQQKWREFHDSKTENGSDITDRKPISMSLTKKDVKKAKRKKKKNIFQSQDKIDDAVASTDTVQSTLPKELRTPSWCLVLDTCSLLDNRSYDALQDLYDIATAVASQAIIQGKEPIQIVVPYMVWNELDYRMKSSSLGEDDKYQARRAVRLLNDFASTVNSDGFQYFHSQTRSEMEQSSKERDKSITITNDEYILLCATQKKQQECSTSNTVMSAFHPNIVLLTLDNVLIGKASSEQIKAMDPVEFKAFYRKRERSLRERFSRA